MRCEWSYGRREPLSSASTPDSSIPIWPQRSPRRRSRHAMWQPRASRQSNMDVRKSSLTSGRGTLRPRFSPTSPPCIRIFSNSGTPTTRHGRAERKAAEWRPARNLSGRYGANDCAGWHGDKHNKPVSTSAYAGAASAIVAARIPESIVVFVTRLSSGGRPVRNVPARDLLLGSATELILSRHDRVFRHREPSAAPLPVTDRVHHYDHRHGATAAAPCGVGGLSGNRRAGGLSASPACRCRDWWWPARGSRSIQP